MKSFFLHSLQKPAHLVEHISTMHYNKNEIPTVAIYTVHFTKGSQFFIIHTEYSQTTQQLPTWPISRQHQISKQYDKTTQYNLKLIAYVVKFCSVNISNCFEVAQAEKSKLTTVPNSTIIHAY